MATSAAFKRVRPHAMVLRLASRLAAEGHARAPVFAPVCLLRRPRQAGEPDNVSAYMWFNLAAAHFPQSDVRHDTAVASRDLLAKQMTREQVAEAQKRAGECMPK